jgi:hypothetical protein
MYIYKLKNKVKLVSIRIQCVTIVNYIKSVKWNQLIPNNFSTTFYLNVWDLNPSIKWDHFIYY